MNHLSVLLAAFLGAAVALLCVLLYLYFRPRSASPSSDAGPEPVPNAVAAVDQYLYDRCCRYMMERRPFLVESFTLQDLANAVYTNKSYLSQTINRFSGKNFKQYVNYYRVMYSMELFRNNMSLRVMDLADLSGFGSETVYLRNFKMVMGEQPSTWCARIRKKKNSKT